MQFTLIMGAIVIEYRFHIYESPGIEKLQFNKIEAFIWSLMYLRFPKLLDRTLVQ